MRGFILNVSWSPKVSELKKLLQLFQKSASSINYDDLIAHHKMNLAFHVKVLDDLEQKRALSEVT